MSAGDGRGEEGGRAAGPLIVAIDGPSGVGKSTAARRLAERLGVPYLDTGAMYRALALEVIERGVDPTDRERVAAAVEAAELALEPEAGGFAVLLHGRPVGERIRSPEVSAASSRISEYPEVRRRMVTLQRAVAGRLGAVVEGRDIGTRVFPDTPHKFFLDARPEVRFERRYEQLRGAGREVTRQAVAEEIAARDRRDLTRRESPLTRDATYTLLDTSDASVDQIVDRMAQAIAERR